MTIYNARQAVAQVNAAAVEAKPVDWAATAKELDPKSPLEIMDHVSNDKGAKSCSNGCLAELIWHMNCSLAGTYIVCTVPEEVHHPHRRR
jgi:hypothetical protein